jgi:hypothetical protein
MQKKSLPRFIGFAQNREAGKNIHFESPFLKKGSSETLDTEVPHVNVKYESYCTRTTWHVRVDTQEEAQA